MKKNNKRKLKVTSKTLSHLSGARFRTVFEKPADRVFGCSTAGISCDEDDRPGNRYN